MEEYDTFKQISLDAFSGLSFSLAEAALRRLIERYPNGRSSHYQTGYPAREHVVEHTGPIPATEDEWIEYASTISQKSPDDEQTQSICRLAQDQKVDAYVVGRSLDLLRRQSTLYMPIREVQSLQPGPNDIGNDGIDSPAIIPYEDGDGWAFAVAYSDCIHWYDSRQGQPLPEFSAAGRQILNGWTGPKQCAERQHDSGIFMLLGIRCISRGAPHVSQEAAEGWDLLFEHVWPWWSCCVGSWSPARTNSHQLVARERAEHMRGIATPP